MVSKLVLHGGDDKTSKLLAAMACPQEHLSLPSHKAVCFRCPVARETLAAFRAAVQSNTGLFAQDLSTVLDLVGTIMGLLFPL